MSTPKPVTQLRDAEGVSRVNALKIDPRLIQIEPGFNYRDYTLQSNLDHVAELKESIRENGVQDDLWVCLDGGRIILMAGECRLRAVMELIAEGVDIKTVPCQQKKGSPEQRLLLALLENTGKPPSIWEVGKGFQRLVDFGWTEEQIARKMGQTVSYVKKALVLATADQGTCHMLDQLAVSPAAAEQAINVHGSGATLVLRKRVEEAKEKEAAKPPSKKKTKNPAKPKPVGREKKSNGVFVPFAELENMVTFFRDYTEGFPARDTETSQEVAEKFVKYLDKLLAKKEGK